MAEFRRPDPASPEGAGQFATTHWSAVLAAGETTSSRSEVALEELCRTYWHPLYAYVRRQVHDPHTAQDLTQGFLAQFLEKRKSKLADPARGKFRSFLLTSIKHYLADQWDRTQAQKRGGGREVLSFEVAAAEDRYQFQGVDLMDPEKLFERRWALTLLEQALARLRKDYEAPGKLEQFELLHRLLLGETSLRYAEAGAQLRMTEAAVKVAVHRMRQSYRRFLRQEIGRTVSEPGEIEEELRYLLTVLSRKSP